jgi:hypothetical protein
MTLQALEAHIWKYPAKHWNPVLSYRRIDGKGDLVLFLDVKVPLGIPWAAQGLIRGFLAPVGQVAFRKKHPRIDLEGVVFQCVMTTEDAWKINGR